MTDPGLLREVLARAGTTVTRCEGGSMWPTIAPGTCLQVRRAPVRVGEVALLEESGRLVLHRVLLRVPGFVVHAGDAWSWGARLVPAAQVLGRVDDVPAHRPSWPRAGLGLLVALLRRARR